MDGEHLLVPPDLNPNRDHPHVALRGNSHRQDIGHSVVQGATPACDIKGWVRVGAMVRVKPGDKPEFTSGTAPTP